MAPEHANSPLHSQLQASLDGLRGLPLGVLDPGALVVALVVLGDAVRLGVDVPRPVLRAAEALPTDAFRRAFATLLEESRAWSLPSEPALNEEEPGYEWAIRQRDEAESAIVAARRILTPRGVLLDELEEARAFDTVVRLLDFTCGGRRSRDDAERALGERVVLATRGSWVEMLPEIEHPRDARGEAPEPHIGTTPTVAPSDEAVDAYITSSDLHAWIESAALRSASFAEELEAMIEAGIACRSTVGFSAHRWLRARKKSSGPLAMAILPRARRAAAAGDCDANHEVELMRAIILAAPAIVGSGWTYDRPAPQGPGSVYRRGELTVIVTLATMEMPDGNGSGPTWLLSVTRRGKRAKDNLVKVALRDFGMLDAEEDNHNPGQARCFFLVCDPARRVACECKTTEQVLVEPDGYRWSNPTPEQLAAGEECRGCQLTPLTGKACPIHAKELAP
jgi:hypothetical protein